VDDASVIKGQGRVEVMPGESQRTHPYYRRHRMLNRIAGLPLLHVEGIVRTLVIVTNAAALGFLALTPFCDPQGQSIPGVLSAAVSWIHARRFVIAATIIGVSLGLQFLTWFFARWRAFDVNKLENVLNTLNTRIFTDQNRNEYQYRTTLFKVRSFPCCGLWLGIVARSGRLYRKWRTVFSIDPNNEAHNTGFVGECWRQDGSTIIAALPAVDDNLGSAEEIDRYVKKGYLDQREYQTVQVRSRVLLATGIRVRGRLWGILILDSTDATQLPKQRKRPTEDLEFAAVAISQLVS